VEEFTSYKTNARSVAEDIFVEVFCEAFGPDKTQFLSIQHPFVDIYGDRRFIDFALENENEKIAIEIDGETYHNPKNISENKYYDDLLKQNSMIYNEWRVYRWAYRQLKNNREKVKDELVIFLGSMPEFRTFDEFLPKQKGHVFALKAHQKEAIESLEQMRKNNESIALLYHATGTGKTVTAVSDAKALGERTLFLAHTKELVYQAKNTFQKLWSEKESGLYLAENKQNDSYVVCASIQSVSQNIDEFKPSDFGYIIVDECHHGAASTYKKVLGYFKPKFTLGLTATPERTDGEDLLQIFKNVAHKLDLKTAVENGELCSVRCIRVKTNIDLSTVKINGIKYESQELESKLFLPERNQIIIDTYIKFVKNKKTVIFCASVKHAQEIAALLLASGVKSQAVSGTLRDSERKQILNDYEYGDVEVLCACDLLNEGWDSPMTEVLFMARPTLSKTLYIQQLGRGMRIIKGKEFLLVFDFIDNCNLFNTPYSLHRMLKIQKYSHGEPVLAQKSDWTRDKDLIFRGEKPEFVLDIPLDTFDYELIELFDWQEETKNMKSQLEFVRMVDVQAETIEKYIREEKLKADLEVPIGEKRTFKYFKEDTIRKYAAEYKWDLITAANMKDKFIDMVKTMDMSFSYKPVLLKAILEHIDDKGKIRISDIVDYFMDFYEERKSNGLFIEKPSSIYAKDNVSRKEVERNIFLNPFKRFEDMRFLKRSTDVEYVEINRHIFKHLTQVEKEWISKHCDEKLKEYYKRFKD